MDMDFYDSDDSDNSDSEFDEFEDDLEDLLLLLLLNEEDSDEADLALATLLLSSTSREDRNFVARLDWMGYISGISESLFARRYRINLLSFKTLCGLVDPHIARHYSSGIRDVEPLPTALILHCLLRWLGGGSYLDIIQTAGVSTSSFYRVLDVGMKAILACKELAIHFPQTEEEVTAVARAFRQVSQNRAIGGCVACIDGFHLPIKRPSKREVDNVKSFYSGHYRTYGINVQAACNEESKLTFLDTAAPGSTNDVVAFERVRLAALISNLPDGFYALGDAAYCCTDKLLTPFTGPQRNEPLKSDYNFYHSQLRMKIECTFGLMTQRWRILQEPLWVKVNKVWKVLQSIGRLHNFCIDQRDNATIHLGARRAPDPEGTRPVGRPAVTTSIVRSIVMESIANRGLARTGANIRRNRNAGSGII